MMSECSTPNQKERNEMQGHLEDQGGEVSVKLTFTSTSVRLAEEIFHLIEEQGNYDLKGSITESRKLVWAHDAWDDQKVRTEQ